MRPWILVALITLGACRFPNADEHFGLVVDADDDGYASDVDCDDSDASIHPGADEVCNDVDDDCNDLVDDDPVDDQLWYEDDDGDGYAATGAASERACEAPAGYTDEFGDCNDADKDINPDATDIPDDDIDQDCNGSDTVACYVDDDQDGHGTDDLTTVFAPDGTCDTSQKESDVADDCDDTNADRYPGNTEIPDDGTDQDCDGIDPDPCYVDDDEDGYGDPDQLVVTVNCTGTKLSTNADDCDDTDDTVEPGGAELCDGQQNDCDNWAGAGDPGTLPADEVDNDGDHQVECTIDGDGWDGDVTVTGGDDCDDTDETVKVGGAELCDGLQNDCDNWEGPTTPGTLPSDEVDDDGDFRVECTIDAGGWDGDGSILGGDDCDDSEIAIYDGAPELCDGLVNDCADWDAPGTPGDLPDAEADLDADGWVACIEDEGGWQGTAVSGYEDCDDDDFYVHPTAPELCDGQDNDCNEIFLAEEIDMISLEEPDGTWTDVTSAWVDNVVTVDVDGTYWVCPETAPYATLPVVTVDGVSIKGRTNDPADVTFDGETAFRAFETNTSGTTLLQGITLLNGGADDDVAVSSRDGYGGAAYLRGGGTVTIDNCVIEDASASNDGGAVYVQNGTVSFTNTLFQNNDATLGGNVYVEAGTVTFDADTDITLGTAVEGGGVYIENGSVTVQGNVEDNEATDDTDGHGGGGLYLLDGTLTLTGALLDGNIANQDGGGIFMVDGTLNASAGTIIRNNEATHQDGAGVLVVAGSVTFDNVHINTNDAGDDGGGLYSIGATVDLTNTDFLSNTSGDNGGGLWQAGGGVTTTGCTFTTNVAADSGGGIFQFGTSTSTHGTITLTGNEARGGGGEGGGAIDILAGTMTLNTATITNNKAQSDPVGTGNDGGALLVDDDAATVNINDSTISGNVADDQGGAIRCFQNGCNVTATDTLIFSNTGEFSGGIHLTGSTASFTCTASEPGAGGVYLNIANDKTDGGGAGYISNGTIISNGCDWGTTGNSDENDPPDIRYDTGDTNALAAFGDDVDFTCNATQCPVP